MVLPCNCIILECEDAHLNECNFLNLMYPFIISINKMILNRVSFFGFGP